MIGPAGNGTSNFVQPSGAIFPYEINFENASTATAPAQAVTITDQLSTSLDWTTFQLDAIVWGDVVLTIPAGSQHFQATVPMTYNGVTFDVEVEAGIHTNTGQVYATFQSIDPNTNLPPDVLTGFLPPEDGTGRGKGDMQFTISPKSNLPTGTQIRNIASITFDVNPPITTDQVNDEDPTQGVDPTKEALVTTDSVAPSSSVLALPATEGATSFTLSWSGQDDTGGSGIASYNIYVSDNGGPYTLFQANTAATSAIFTGQPSHTYGFYSVATDNVGNVQPTPAKAQASTDVIILSPMLSGLSAPSTIQYGTSTVTFSGVIAAGTSYPATTENVAVTFNGVTQNAAIGTNGIFTTTFNTATLAASTTPYAVTYTYNGDAQFANASNTSATTVLVNKAAAMVTLTKLSQTYTGSTEFAAASTVPVGLTVNLTYSQNGNMVTNPTNAGSYGVSATVNNPNYQGTATGTLVIAPSSQTITFGTLPGVSYGASPITLGASATSGQTITFSVVSGPGALTGNVLTITGAGTVLLDANQAGNSNYLAASTVQQSLIVGLATPTFSNLSIPPTIPDGTSSVTFAGVIAAGSIYPASGDTVAVTLDGITQRAAIGTGGAFSATFNTAALSASTTPYTVTYAYNGDVNFSSASNTSATTLTVLQGVGITPSRLIFATEPESATKGAAILVTIDVEDANGGVVMADTSDVTLSIAGGPSGAILGGMLTVPVVNGVAQFQVTPSKAGAYALIANDTDNHVEFTPITSTSFSVGQLVITQQPTNATAGGSIPIVVNVEKPSGKTIAADGMDVTLSIKKGPTGAMLSGTATIATVNGVATFSGVSLTEAGTYRLTATDGDLTINTGKFTVSPAASAKLVFVQPPSAGVVGTVITPNIVADIEDPFGNLVTDDNSDVILIIKPGTGPAGAILEGTLTLAAQNGVATFSDISLSETGMYKLKAKDGMLTRALSMLFLVSAAS